MRRIDEILASRRRVAELYNTALSQITGIQVPMLHHDSWHVSWFVYVIRLDENFTQGDRDSMVEHLVRQGIGCGRYFAPIHIQPAYSDFTLRHPLPITDFVSHRTIALPFFNRLSAENVSDVADALKAEILAYRR